ncbi:MAG: hypothetical protein ACYCT1_08435 [Steroidobacteraceae bacterium]
MASVLLVIPEAGLVNDDSGALVGVINADTSAVVIGNAKVKGLVNLGTSAFSGYPLVLGTDTGESIPTLTTTNGLTVGDGDLLLNRQDQAAAFITRPNVTGYKTISLAVAGGGNLDAINLLANSVKTPNNTLDDGSGNAKVYETLVVGSGADGYAYQMNPNLGNYLDDLWNAHYVGGTGWVSTNGGPGVRVGLYGGTAETASIQFDVSGDATSLAAGDAFTSFPTVFVITATEADFYVGTVFHQPTTMNQGSFLYVPSSGYYDAQWATNGGTVQGINGDMLGIAESGVAWLLALDHNGSLGLAGDVVAPNLMRYQTFTSSGTYTVPDGVYRLFCYLWGGGGGGGGGQAGVNQGGGIYSQGSSGGGGGSGAYAAGSCFVTPGQQITVTVGGGGAGGAGATSGTAGGGSGGGTTTFSVFVAYGGSGGSGAVYNGVGGGGGAGASVGSGSFSQTGGNSGSAGVSSGNGGSPGYATFGGGLGEPGSSRSAGGAGGNGSTSSSAGSNGTAGEAGEVTIYW